MVEEHVEHSTALHSHLLDGTRYLVGPLARYALNRDRLSPTAREAACSWKSSIAAAISRSRS